MEFVFHNESTNIEHSFLVCIDDFGPGWRTRHWEERIRGEADDQTCTTQ